MDEIDDGDFVDFDDSSDEDDTVAVNNNVKKSTTTSNSISALDAELAKFTERQSIKRNSLLGFGDDGNDDHDDTENGGYLDMDMPGFEDDDSDVDAEFEVKDGFDTPAFEIGSTTEGHGGYLEMGSSGADGVEGGYLEMGSDEVVEPTLTPAVTELIPTVDSWEIFSAIEANDEDEVDVLVELGGSLSELSKSGHTPLQHAVNLGFEDMVTALCLLDADPNQNNSSGHTALDLAVLSSNQSMADVLLTLGGAHSLGFSKPQKKKKGGGKHDVGLDPSDVGRKCTVRGYMGSGTVRFVGLHKIKQKEFVGVELDVKIGKNTGTVGGHFYFGPCPANHGLLVPAWKVTLDKAPKKKKKAVKSKPKKKLFDPDVPVVLSRIANESFGLSVSDFQGKSYITQIKENGICDLDGRLVEGLQVVAINDEDVSTKTKFDIVSILRSNNDVSITADFDVQGYTEYSEFRLEMAISKAKIEFEKMHEQCETFEDIRMRGAYDSIPKDVEMVRFNGRDYYAVKKRAVAQVAHPGPKLRNVSKLPKGLKLPRVSRRDGHYCAVIPQPDNLPKKCFQLLLIKNTDAMEDDRVVPVIYSMEDRKTQSFDSRDTAQDLSEFWKKGSCNDINKLSYEFYLNVATRMLTFDDPQVIPHPVGSATLVSLCYRYANLHRIGGDRTMWSIPPQDDVAFDKLDRNVLDKTELPAEVWNKTLNRHLDIMPNARTRVILGTPKDSVVARYINANFVRGWNGEPRKYICAMGPKTNTTHSFWQMVLENFVPIIVMATKFVEKELPKCAVYFPSAVGPENAVVFDDIQISTVSKTQGPGYIHSLLNVTRHGQWGSQRSIHHYWYNTWPDHGIPKKKKKPYPDDVLKMLDEVDMTRAHLGLNKVLGPTLLHCSAGVGRSGTLICVDHARNLLKHHAKCDPVSIVKTVREDRVSLVQHPNQFHFFHAACLRFSERQGRTWTIQGSDQQEKVLSLAQAFGKLKEEQADAQARVAESITGNDATLNVDLDLFSDKVASDA